MAATSPAARPPRPHPDLAEASMRAAASAVPPEFRATPQYVHDGLSGRLDAPVVVKVECANPIGAFKGRGTWLAIQRLVAGGAVNADRPVVVASSGNFGQGVAYAARAAGVPAASWAGALADRGRLDGAALIIITGSNAAQA